MTNRAALFIYLFIPFPVQACSAKSLERLRSQQESLRSLQPQVVYLKDLVQGLVQDVPRMPGHATEGSQRLQEQAANTEKQFADVTDKVRGHGKYYTDAADQHFFAVVGGIRSIY